MSSRSLSPGEIAHGSSLMRPFAPPARIARPPDFGTKITGRYRIGLERETRNLRGKKSIKIFQKLSPRDSTRTSSYICIRSLRGISTKNSSAFNKNALLSPSKLLPSRFPYHRRRGRKKSLRLITFTFSFILRRRDGM